MAICPHCETSVDELLAPCPNGDGFFCVDEAVLASHSDELLLGRQIAGRYIISGVLGQGAMGRVYKARQEQVGRHVALKVFRAEKLAQKSLGRRGTIVEVDAARARFIQEAQVLGKLSHPNCVTIYDFGTTDDDSVLYMAMEFVAGVSLREAVSRGLKFEATAEIIRQILQALREAHALGIVHRDLKPDNILLSYRHSTDEYVVKVLDFGIAKLLQSKDPSITRAGMLFGTPAYMSPEQCRGEVDGVGPQADIYALGCMIYEMICGQLPYPAQFPQQMVRLHQEAEIPALQPSKGVKLPAGIEEFVRKCLAKDALERFEDARAALSAFEQIINDHIRQGAQPFAAGGLSPEQFSFNFAVSGASAGAAQRARSIVVPGDHVKGHKLNPLGKEQGAPSGADESPQADGGHKLKRAEDAPAAAEDMGAEDAASEGDLDAQDEDRSQLKTPRDEPAEEIESTLKNKAASEEAEASASLSAELLSAQKNSNRKPVSAEPQRKRLLIAAGLSVALCLVLLLIFLIVWIF